MHPVLVADSAASLSPCSVRGAERLREPNPWPAYRRGVSPRTGHIVSVPRESESMVKRVTPRNRAAPVMPLNRTGRLARILPVATDASRWSEGGVGKGQTR